MRVLAIDQSLTCTGVCIMEGALDGSLSLIHTESIQRCKTSKECSYMDTVLRSQSIAQRLWDLFHDYKCDHVMFEGLSFGSRGDATRNLAMLIGIILAKLNTQFTSIAPTSLKKFATGNGRADKKIMLEAIRTKDVNLHSKLDIMTIKAGKYDIADAYWLARYYLEKLNANINSN